MLLPNICQYLQICHFLPIFIRFTIYTCMSILINVPIYTVFHMCVHVSLMIIIYINIYKFVNLYICSDIFSYQYRCMFLPGSLCPHYMQIHYVYIHITITPNNRD
jgi:hypothetical protein